MRIWFIILLLITNTTIIKAQACNPAKTKVYHLDATKNTLPRFVVACIKAASQPQAYPPRGFIIFLGQTPQGIYTIEGGQIAYLITNTGGFAYFCFTSYDGKRTMDTLYQGQNMKTFDEQVVLRKLWRWHKQGKYKVDHLDSVFYRFNVKFSSDHPKLPDKVTWLVKVENPTVKSYLYWHLKITSEGGCACFYSWKVTKDIIH